MIPAMLKTVRWCLTLGAKFGRVVPLHTLAIVLLTLVSQIATLLASFLPLKVVILLGSDRIPRYFPAYLAELDRDVVIVALSIATVGFFLLYLLAERLIAWATARATRRLLAKSHKMVLFENQDEVAAGAYQRYSRALASGVFVLLALFGLGYFYPAITVVILGYVALTLIALILSMGISTSIHERLETRIIPTLNLIGGIGFSIVFGYLVADFIFWSPPGVMTAIISLLASRQIMLRLSGGIGDITTLQGQHQKLDALFFHGKVLLPQQERADKTIWPLLDPRERNDWLRPLLTEFLCGPLGELTSNWHQSGVHNVVGLRVQTDDKQYLIKLFESNRSSFALHEATLMSETLKVLPSLPWIGATQVQRHYCLVYVLPPGASPALSQVKQCVFQLKTQLLAVEPPNGLIQLFQRSKPMLWQRLDGAVLERLRSAADTPQQRDNVELFLGQLQTLGRELRALPLSVVAPDIESYDALWLREDAPPVLTNWHSWSLEPVGAGWLDRADALPLLGPALIEAASIRTNLSSLALKQAELAALAFLLERECNRQRFVKAIELLPAILERLTSHESTQTEVEVAP